jgi:hypothetical protein
MGNANAEIGIVNGILKSCDTCRGIKALGDFLYLGELIDFGR